MAIKGQLGAVYTLAPDAESKLFAGGAQECDACAEFIRYCVAEGLRYLDPAKEVKVYRNDKLITDGGYYVEHIRGCVVFREAQDEEDEIKVLASYFDPDDIEQSGGCFSWSLSPAVDERDVTTFKSARESGGWRSYIGLLKSWSASADAFWGDDSFMASLGKMVILRLYLDAGESQDCMEGYAIVTSDAVDTPVDDVVEESIDFQGTGLLLPLFEEEGEGLDGGAGAHAMGGPGLGGMDVPDEGEDDENEEEDDED